ncbi:MAG: tetratricopeptide repeat protein [Thermodesulfobacteriota bacterium]
MSRGIAAYKAGQYAQAVAKLAQYRQENPSSAEACRYHALALSSLGQKPEALAEVEGGLAQHPQDLPLILLRGRLLVELERPQEAVAAFSQAIKLDPEQAEAWKERGKVRAQVDLLTAAAQDLDQAARLAPEDPEVFDQRGLVRVSQGRFKAAEQDFQTAIQLRPDQPLPYFHRGNLYFYHLQDREKALADYQEACRLGHSPSCLQLTKLGAEVPPETPPQGEGQKDIKLFGEGLIEEQGTPPQDTVTLRLPDGGAAKPGPRVQIAPAKKKAPSQSQPAITLENTFYPLFKGLPLPLIVITFLFFLCLTEGAMLVLSDTERRHKRRLKKRLKYLEELKRRPPAESLLKVDNLSGIPWLRQTIKKIRRLERLQLLLIQADVNWPLGVVLLLTFFLGALGLSLGFFKWGPLGALAGMGLGLMLPYRLLLFKKKLRTRAFEKQLPDALDLLARGMKAGHAFPTGLQMVAEEMPNPIGLEFFKTFKEYNHGMDLGSALINMCQRVELRELRFFATAVMIQRETGGNLTEILEKISSLIRERFKLRNQIKALSAEGRLSGWILILMPPAIFLVMLKINPDYALLLVQHSLGKMMALIAISFQVLGMLAIRRIVNIKV